MGTLAPTAAVPSHIGIIMDGNGRWALQRNMKRTRGHQEGIEAAKRVVRKALDLGVATLSLYAFSTENWRRAKEEVSFIMALVAKNLRDQYDFYRENRICVRHSGNLAGLPGSVRKEIDAVSHETSSFDALTVNLAVNYGGRDEIVRAVNRVIDARSTGEVTEADIASHLDLADLPEPDLIIRTGGEHRLSNFLLWECAYSELYFSDRLWPDWGGDDLERAVHDFQGRRRNYGGIRK